MKYGKKHFKPDIVKCATDCLSDSTRKPGEKSPINKGRREAIVYTSVPESYSNCTSTLHSWLHRNYMKVFDSLPVFCMVRIKAFCFENVLTSIVVRLPLSREHHHMVL